MLVDLYAVLSTTPDQHGCPCKPNKKKEAYVITKGASASLSFNYTDLLCSFDDIVQFTFVMKQGRTVYSFDALDAQKNCKSYPADGVRFELDDTFITMWLDPGFTAGLKDTDRRGTLVIYEVAVQINNGTATAPVINTMLYEQPGIAVRDSAYSEVISEE